MTGRNSTHHSITTEALWYILVGQDVIVRFRFTSKFDHSPKKRKSGNGVTTFVYVMFPP